MFATYLQNEAKRWLCARATERRMNDDQSFEENNKINITTINMIGRRKKTHLLKQTMRMMINRRKKMIMVSMMMRLKKRMRIIIQCQYDNHQHDRKNKQLARQTMIRSNTE